MANNKTTNDAKIIKPLVKVNLPLNFVKPIKPYTNIKHKMPIFDAHKRMQTVKSTPIIFEKLRSERADLNQIG